MRKNIKINEIFNFKKRYLRSANLEKDFFDPAALDDYIITQNIISNFERIKKGLNHNSAQRAWRITGDYGSGKSSFALYLARVLSSSKEIDAKQLGNMLIGYLPVLVTGARVPIPYAIASAVVSALETLSIDAGAKLDIDIAGRKKYLAKTGKGLTDQNAIDFILSVNTELIEKKVSSGLLIIIDELGKFLEHAALNPEKQDIYFLQRLAEIANRSSIKPLFIVGLLHQGFSAYADQLSQTAQSEWEKIAGRFEELIFNQPIDQVVELIASAINISDKVFSSRQKSFMRRQMKETLNLGWFGIATKDKSFSEQASRLYPLHPTVIPVLFKLFNKFGQNERSLFSFLLSSEPFGLQDFSQRNVVSNNIMYRLHDLYDYAAANFGYRLSSQTYRNHWNYISSVVESFPSSDENEIKILKTIGLLNLINLPEIIASEDAILLAVASNEPNHSIIIKNILNNLHKKNGIIFSRGRAGGLCLWSHTSIDLDDAYSRANGFLGSSQRVVTRIRDQLATKPIVARRHYIQTGNLRTFNVIYVDSFDLTDLLDYPADNNTRIIIVLCENKQEEHDCIKILRAYHSEKTIIGIAKPLSHLSGLIKEVDCWKWIQSNVLELKDDRYAAEEVSRQLSSAVTILDKRIKFYIGLDQQSYKSSSDSIAWFYKGTKIEPFLGTKFLSFLSDTCDEVYPEAPRIQNELVNREVLSTPASSARLRLLERMFNNENLNLLGMDRLKRPPEMSIYFSLLFNTKAHRVDGVNWAISMPEEGDDPCNLRPSLKKIIDLLELKNESRIAVDEIYHALSEPPFGIKSGLMPILLTIVLIERRREIAIYENGTFLSEFNNEEIRRLVKAPSSFELQICKIKGIRSEVFKKLASSLNISSNGSVEILDIVRQLCMFVAKLPQYTLRTDRLSDKTKAIRAAILNACEPNRLIFTDLPIACGIKPFCVDYRANDGSSEQFVSRLSESLEELRQSYHRLKERIISSFLEDFSLDRTTSFSLLRGQLEERSQNLLLNVRDMELKALCLRLIDTSLPDSEWIESIGSYIATTPPFHWKDEDEVVYLEKLKNLSRKYLKAELMTHYALEEGYHSVFRVSIMNKAGFEKEKTVHLATESPEFLKIKDKLKQLIRSEQTNHTTSALAQALWELLGEIDGQ